MDFWKGKRVLVTGACGTIGAELVRQLHAEGGLGELIGLDNNESAIFEIDERYRQSPRMRFFVGDIRDRDMLSRKMAEVDVVLHTAALKHVILSERSPSDVVQTNVLGVQNVVEAATTQHVERVIFTSSDKAVNPTSVMGTSKLMGERLLTAANANRRDSHPVFASTRFGNVLGSRGSVIPIFRRQIRAGGPLTLTHPEMTRFVMTLREATRLVLDSVSLAVGGEVFVTKMPIVRIEDLAKAMIELMAPTYGYRPEDVSIEVIGPKPGEKLYEELVNEEEVRRTLSLERYHVVVPALRSESHLVEYRYPCQSADRLDIAYNSGTQPPMTLEEIKAYLMEHGVLAEEMGQVPAEDYATDRVVVGGSI